MAPNVVSGLPYLQQLVTYHAGLLSTRLYTQDLDSFLEKVSLPNGETSTLFTKYTGNEYFDLSVYRDEKGPWEHTVNTNIGENVMCTSNNDERDTEKLGHLQEHDQIQEQHQKDHDQSQEQRQGKEQEEEQHNKIEELSINSPTY